MLLLIVINKILYAYVIQSIVYTTYVPLYNNNHSGNLIEEKMFNPELSSLVTS